MAMTELALAVRCSGRGTPEFPPLSSKVQREVELGVRPGFESSV